MIIIQPRNNYYDVKKYVNVRICLSNLIYNCDTHQQQYKKIGEMGGCGK